MSGKLDQSLDEILSNNPRGGRGGRRARLGRTAKKPTAAPTAPAAGIQKKKNTKPAKGTPKAPAASTVIGPKKILVSGLPKDVTETMLKEYFSDKKVGGPLSRVELSYGPNGVSRGVANVIFRDSASASKALTKSGVLVDNHPIKIELLMDAESAKSLPPPKALSERIAQPKAQPKSAAAAPKQTANAATRGKATRGKGRGGRGGRSSRPVKKTAEQLDSEMADYFENAGGSTGNEQNAAPAAPAGDDAMGDVE